MGQAAAAVVAVLVGQVRGRGMSVHGARVGVAQRAAIGRAGWEGTFVLRVPGRVQPVDWVDVREPGRVLLVCRVSVSKL